MTKKRGTENLVEVHVTSKNPDTGEISKSGRKGKCLILAVVQPDLASFTHITGEITADDLFSMMLLLAERIEALLIKDYGYAPHVDVGTVLTRVKEEQALMEADSQTKN